ncbi:MAG: hypothetical protein AAF490_05330 [Chloroflexota bacterium]
MMKYEPSKLVWTNIDFPELGWHDAKIWSFVAIPNSFEFAVDLDYIFQWIQPKIDEINFKFWVSPVTIVFENAFDISVDIDSNQGEIYISDLLMEKRGMSANGRLMLYSFRFECEEGSICLGATGFKMYVRQKPQLLERQSLLYEERGGIKFSRALE